MNIKRILCASLCVVLLSATACGKAETPDVQTLAETSAETTAAAVTLTGQTEETETTDAAAAQTDAPDETETETGTEAFDPHNGLNSTDVQEVLEFYQWAASFNDKPQYTKTLTLISIDGGSEKLNKSLNVFEPIARKAVAKNSITGDKMPGQYKNIRVSDWQSATAVSDGKYTTITVHVVPQTDTAYGKEYEGSVGRSMTVLDGMAVAIDEMPGVSADFATGDVKMEYLNPTVKVKVDNRTGLFVPGTCSWSYRVHPMLTSLDAKVLAFNIHLENAEGYVDYKMSY